MLPGLDRDAPRDAVRHQAASASPTDHTHAASCSWSFISFCEKQQGSPGVKKKPPTPPTPGLSPGSVPPPQKTPLSATAGKEQGLTPQHPQGSAWLLAGTEQSHGTGRTGAAAAGQGGGVSGDTGAGSWLLAPSLGTEQWPPPALRPPLSASGRRLSARREVSSSGSGYWRFIFLDFFFCPFFAFFF